MASSDEMAPDFNTKTCKQLRALLTSRKVKHKDLKLKAQLVAAADESEARKRKVEEELEREEAKKRKIEYDALLTQVQERGLKLEGTTLQALRDILQYDNKRKHKDEIWRGLFKRDFKADPARNPSQIFRARSETSVMVTSSTILFLPTKHRPSATNQNMTGSRCEVSGVRSSMPSPLPCSKWGR